MPVKDTKYIRGRFYKLKGIYSTKAEATKAKGKQTGRTFKLKKGYSVYLRYYPFGRAKF
jgi:ribosomal protein L5